VSSTLKVLKYELEDVRRSRGVLAYTILLLAVTEALLRFGGDSGKALVSLLFGTTYLYSARDFTELLLAQPLPRGALFRGLYLGLSMPLATGFLVGVGAPFVWHGEVATAAGGLVSLLAVGVVLTFVFTALASLTAIVVDDRSRGLGAAFVIWLIAALLYDGLTLLLVTNFGDYPLERALIGLTLLNPVDLARVLLLLKFDTGALMGYTGAVFERFFGTTQGMLVAGCALLVWAFVPLQLAARRFRAKDF
jgi:Cu-processing system permease protein